MQHSDAWKEMSLSRARLFRAAIACVIHASENDRGVPGGGYIGFPAIRAVLRKIGYDSYLLPDD